MTKREAGAVEPAVRGRLRRRDQAFRAPRSSIAGPPPDEESNAAWM